MFCDQSMSRVGSREQNKHSSSVKLPINLKINDSGSRYPYQAAGHSRDDGADVG